VASVGLAVATEDMDVTRGSIFVLGVGFRSQGSSCVFGTRPIMAGPLERLGVGAVVNMPPCATDVGDVVRAMAGGNAMSDKPTAPIAATATRAAALNAMRGGEEEVLLFFLTGEAIRAMGDADFLMEAGRFSPEAMSCTLPLLSS